MTAAFQTNKMASAFVERQAKRTAQNLQRAEKLVKMYQDHYGNLHSRRLAHQTDILRAAVVFTHASLEDFIRSVRRAFLPFAEAEALKDVPLAGSKGRAERFSISDLVAHRDKTVQELLRQSVDEYLETSSYGNPGEIIKVLAALRIDLREFKGLLSKIGAMTQRRHAIVHRADRLETGSARHSKTAELDADTVSSWIQATTTLVLAVFGRLPVTRVKRTKRST